MAQSSVFKRMQTLIAVRAFFVTVLLGTFFIFDIGYTIFPYPFAVTYIIAALYALTIVYSLLLGRVGELPLAYAQLLLDVVASMALVFLTGGIESWFSSLPLIITIAAAIVLNKKAGYITAIAGSILYGSLVDLQYYKVLPIPYDPMLLEKDFLYNIFSHITALLLTAYLTGHLTSRLEKKVIDFDDLSAFNKEVIDNTPSGLFTTDNAGFVKIFNRSAVEITGMEKARTVGLHIESVFPFVKDLGEMERVEEEISTAGGTKVIGMTTTRMRDAKGAQIGYIGIFQDLTEIKRLEEEITQNKSLAAIGELSANIAHEIRNPLASLRGSVEMMKEGVVSGEKRERLMKIALGEMDRLNAIITDFLEYSKPRPVEKRAFDLHAALVETVEMLKAGSPPGTRLRETSPSSLVIEADEEKLRQVFWNIGVNALEAMPGGGTLTVGASVSNGHVKIAFEDTGSGIDFDDRERIFYPFYTTKKKGTGLGLSIANRIVEDHGGSISVRSAPGRWTRFEVSIPAEA